MALEVNNRIVMFQVAQMTIHGNEDVGSHKDEATDRPVFLKIEVPGGKAHKQIPQNMLLPVVLHALWMNANKLLFLDIILEKYLNLS